MKTDLHIHTNQSDGSLKVEEIMQISSLKGMDIVAITDHETTSGVTKAQNIAPDYGIRIIPGLELNTYYKNQEIHLLGYYRDINNDYLQEKLQQIRKERTAVTKLMLGKLKDLGLMLEWQEIENTASFEGVVSKSHIIYSIWNKTERDQNLTINWDNLASCLRPGGTAYIPYEGNPFPDAVDLILETGGLPVLAHPGLIDQSLTEDLLSYKPIGIEVYYGYWAQREEKITYFEELSRKYRTLATGGSDYHGFFSQVEIGEVSVPEKCVLNLMEYLQID